MTSPLVRSERHGPVLLLQLDRPDARNALSRELVEQLADELTRSASDPTVRVVVITGSDTTFCAGADISEIPRMRGALPSDELPFDRLFETVAALPQPSIAAVRGAALGGGCELAQACDLAIAGTGARFGVPEVRLGVIPGAGGTQRLVRAVGKAKAMQMLLTGATMDAAWAERAGLVAEVVEDERVLDRALDLAAEIAANSPEAVRLAADAARTAPEAGLRQGLAHERRNFLLALATPNAAEGVAAFIERRAPQFANQAKGTP